MVSLRIDLPQPFRRLPWHLYWLPEYSAHDIIVFVPLRPTRLLVHLSWRLFDLNYSLYRDSSWYSFRNALRFGQTVPYLASLSRVYLCCKYL